MSLDFLLSLILKVWIISSSRRVTQFFFFFLLFPIDREYRYSFWNFGLFLLSYGYLDSVYRKVGGRRFRWSRGGNEMSELRGDRLSRSFLNFRTRSKSARTGAESAGGSRSASRESRPEFVGDKRIWKSFSFRFTYSAHVIFIDHANSRNLLRFSVSFPLVTFAFAHASPRKIARIGVSRCFVIFNRLSSGCLIGRKLSAGGGIKMTQGGVGKNRERSWKFANYMEVRSKGFESFNWVNCSALKLAKNVQCYYLIISQNISIVFPRAGATRVIRGLARAYNEQDKIIKTLGLEIKQSRCSHRKNERI